MEREAIGTRNDARTRLSQLDSRILRERMLMEEAARNEIALSDENAALSTLLVNSTVELETRSKLFLQKAYEDAEAALTAHPGIRSMKSRLDELIAAKNEILDTVARNRTDYCRRLNRLFALGVNDSDPVECAATIASQYDEIVTAVTSCERAIEFIDRDMSAESLDELFRLCEPLRNLRTIHMLDDVRKNYWSQLDRRERLNVARTVATAVPLNDYAVEMNSYLNWLACLESVVSSNFTVASDDVETKVAYPRGDDGVAKLQSYPDSAYMRRLVSIAMGVTTDDRLANHDRRHGRLKPLGRPDVSAAYQVRGGHHRRDQRIVPNHRIDPARCFILCSVGASRRRYRSKRFPQNNAIVLV